MENSVTGNSEVLEKKDGDKTQADILVDAIREDRNYTPYNSASSCISIGSVVPAKLSYETVESLNKFIQNGIDTAEFVRDRLKYNSRVMVCQAFASEQTDALALAIVQLESKKGFILGDGAGIGKGRVMAGLCRYARQIGKIPVFMTARASLFSDIYRDFYDIGGFDGTAPARNDNQLPKPFIFNDGGEGGVVEKVVDQQTIRLFTALKKSETVALCSRKVMPFGYDMVMLTYSQLSADLSNVANANAKTQFEFLQAIAPNCIFMLDESHKGAGDSCLGHNLADLISYSGGVVFASATYAKVPKSMVLYMPKTDIKDSNINEDTIINAVAENGEAIQEYIASLLVRGGQMIRRQRTFEKCRVDYNYMKSEDKPYYYGMYDKVMELYNTIEAFSKSDLYKSAVDSAILRITLEEKIELVSSNDRKPKSNKPEELRAWQERNKNKYGSRFSVIDVAGNRFNWIENLLFCIKADFVADAVIKAMKSRERTDENGKVVPNMVEYEIGNEKSMVLTNIKPIIAVRNTGEANLRALGYKAGDVLTPEQNDYAKSLVNVIRKLTEGKMIFTPANPANKRIVIENAKVLDVDFADNGKRYHEIVAQMQGAVSGLKLSPIDYMTDKIERTARENWDYEFNSSPTFTVQEVTRRGLAIKAMEDGNFKVINRTEKSTTEKVAMFNSGRADVIILNTSGSTGLSLHSKMDFEDRRPRAMFIHQVQLDVNEEVQLRGRINRTGQVNNPAYIYCVSVIPSEIRKLMMLRRKMRSLDANVTGDVKQSAKASEIRDAEGNVIEDMCNKYGYQALLDFKELTGNEVFYDIFEASEGWYNGNSSPDEKFENYLREVEKIPCKDQEDFYNRMNAYYVGIMEKKKAADEWDIDTTTENLKSSVKNALVLYAGNEKNQFTKSVFIADNFVAAKGKPFTKDELHDAQIEMAGTKDLMDFKESLGEPDLSNAKTEEEKEKIIATHKRIVDEKVQNAELKLKVIKNTLVWFAPDKTIQMPLDIELLDSGAWDSEHGRKQISGDVGAVVGIKLLNKGENRFSPMNIEIHLASVSKIRPHLVITLTKQYLPIAEWIMSGQRSDNEEARKRLWEIPNTISRDVMRVLTGELFKAFELANNIFNSNKNYTGRKKLIKYTTAAGTVETGIKLWTKKHFDLTVDNTPTFGTINSEKYKTQLFEMAENTINWLPSKKEMFLKKNGNYSFNVCTGVSRNKSGRNRGEEKKVDKGYLSDYANQEFINDLGEAIQLPYSYENWNLNMYSKGEKVWLYGMKFISFHFGESEAQKLLDFLYSKSKTLMQLNEGGKQKFEVYDMEDMGADGEKKSEAGEYFYYPLLRFDPNTPPPDYIEGSYKSVPENEKGIIALRFTLSAVQAGIYKLVPANISEVQAMRNILILLENDEARSRYKEKVKAFGNDYVGIAGYTQSVIGVPPMYAIGLVDSYDAGRIISENIDVTNESVEDKRVEPSANEGDKEPIPLSWDTLQDFIIQMKSL